MGTEAGAAAMCPGCAELRTDGSATIAQPEPVATTPKPSSFAATLSLVRHMSLVVDDGVPRRHTRKGDLQKHP